jgi:hypothetical protein
MHTFLQSGLAGSRPTIADLSLASSPTVGRAKSSLRDRAKRRQPARRTAATVALGCNEADMPSH